jgi:hypothetical protein
VNGFVEGCLAEAEHGQIGTFLTYGAGPAVAAGHSGSLEVTEETSNANTLEELGGRFDYVSVGGGAEGGGASLGSFWGCSNGESIVGGVFGVGASFPGVSIQGGISNTIDIHSYGGWSALGPGQGTHGSVRRAD